MLETFFELRICQYVEQCLERLSQILLLRYSRAESYSISQIESAMHFAQLGDDHRPYAYALFMDRETFESAKHNLPPHTDYHTLICDIEETLMPGRTWRILMRKMNQLPRSVSTGFAGPPPRGVSMAWALAQKAEADRFKKARESRRQRQTTTPRIATS